MSSTLDDVISLTPEHRKLSSHYEDIYDFPGVVMDLELFEKKKKDRILPFIVTSAHVDSDNEIDNIESIAKLIPEMLNSERGVSITLMHTDTINGKVKHLEYTTIGKVAEIYPKMKNRLNVDVNRDVPCIYGWAKMYTDTPALDDQVWKLVQSGVLGGVSLRGVGKTKKHSKVCDVEGNCGKEVTGTKFWSVTLSEDGQQAKPYSVVLQKMKTQEVKIMNDNDCGGTVSDVEKKDSVIARLTLENMELKQKMKEDEQLLLDQKKKMEEEDKPEEEEMTKATCPKCGESYEMEKAKTKDHTLVPDEQLNKLLDDAEQLRKMRLQEESPTQKRLSEYFNGTQVKTKTLPEQPDIRAIVKELLKEDPEAFGLQKTRTPEGVAGGTKTEPPNEEVIEDVPGLETINEYAMKTKLRKATQPEVIDIQINGKKLEEVFN